MINVGIIGGETEAAGELIRILLNHPDVILRAVCSPDHAGERLDAFHRGLIGDTDLRFVRSLDDERLNCVFLAGEPWQAQEYVESLADQPLRKDIAEDEAEDMLHVIDMTGRYRSGEAGMVYGLAEHRRKELVRGALRCSIPSPLAEALELALFPLAKNHLIQGRVKGKIERAFSLDSASTCRELERGPDASLSSQLSTRFDPVAPRLHRPDEVSAAREAEEELHQIDPCFAGEIDATLSTNPDMGRGIRVVADVPCGINLEEVRRLYEEAYEDHAFAYLVDRRPDVEDIANTNKCLIHVEYAANNPAISVGAVEGVRVTAVLDNLVKGSAGNAVHCMNLLFGLSERTGLALKASTV